MKLVYLTVPILTSAALLPTFENNILHKITSTIEDNISGQNKTNICEEETYKIENNDDLQNLKDNCSQLKGDLEISSSYKDSVLDLNSLHGIGGNLKIINCSALSMIKSNTLRSIAGDLILRNITTLKTIDLSKLEEVQGIDLKTLPLLNSFTISDTKDKNFDKFSISDTALSELTQIDKIAKINVIDINNNRYLDKIGLNKIERVDDYFNIHGNGKNLQIDFPNLWTTGNFSVRDIKKLSLPKLNQVNSSMDIHETSVSQLDIPELKRVSGSLAVVNNDNLTNLKINNVTEINGGLLIANNTKLDTLGSFSNLKTIGGGINFEGSFNDTNFPNLKIIKGSAFINTTSSEFDCENWFGDDVSKKTIVRGGKYVCSTGEKTTSGQVNDRGQVTDKKEYNSTYSSSGTKDYHDATQYKSNDSNSYPSSTTDVFNEENRNKVTSGGSRIESVPQSLVILFVLSLITYLCSF